MKLGFIGTGRIAADLVEGLCGSAPLGERIYLSPRNRDVSSHLAAAYPGVEVCLDNQSVVESSEIVFLSVLPAAAEDVLRGLRFRPAQVLISLVAMTPLEWVRALAPSATIVRAVPLPSVKRRQSPTAVYPDNPLVRDIFDRLGRAVVLEDEEAFCVVEAVTGLIKPVYVTLSEVSSWMASHGVPEPIAASFVVRQFHSMLGLAAEEGSPGLESLSAGAATRGGLNQQATEFLRNAGTFGDFTDALDAVLARIVRQSAGSPAPSGNKTP
jgi:pyrroline-5-carboxylate reductase